MGAITRTWRPFLCAILFEAELKDKTAYRKWQGSLPGSRRLAGVSQS